MFTYIPQQTLTEEIQIHECIACTIIIFVQNHTYSSRVFMYILSRFGIKQWRNHGLVCSLSCIATTCVRNWGQPPTCGNIAIYGIYMMAPSMAESCRTSCLPYLDARVGSSSLVQVASSHINIKTANKQV